MELQKIKDLVAQLTLEEKAGLTSGKDNWFTKAVERLGIPSVRTSDGPHGLRTMSGELNSLDEKQAIPATCYPAACATGSSFDRELVAEMAAQLGREAQALGVNVVLGPGVNMKRSPLCGRNFEYFAEDPFLAGQLGAAYTNAMQAQGVGVSLKHFAANSQEHRRVSSSSEMDERTFREIYLLAFEQTVKLAQPWTVMASYNKIGGVHSTANKNLLTKILRDEWGFEGLVMSDWGATHDRAAAVEAGCDLTMPAEDTDALVVEAVKSGRLSEDALDACCVRVLELAFKAAENAREAEFDYEIGHAVARKAASESAVLLKNDGILPVESGSVAFIGAFAEKPRYQGGGSSHINSYRVVGALEAAKNAGLDVVYARGYGDDGNTTDELLAEAVAAAKSADTAVLFVGLPDSFETEGSDRRHLHLPAGHDALVEAVCAANPNTVVVLHNGSPVEMPWADAPRAILEMYLGGQAVGEATVDLLTGKVNPSGHLAESFPKKLEDNPSYLYYFGEGSVVSYNEGLFIGYRYYESKKQDVLYPFGHGLSYTNFEYSNLRADKTTLDESENLTVSVDVTNTGSRIGKTVVQLYVAPSKHEVIRPVRELKEFAKVELAPGETKTVTFTLTPRAFAHWSAVVHEWRIEDGEFTIQIGASAHDILLAETVRVNALPIPPVGGYSVGSPMSDFAKHPKGRKFLDENIGSMLRGMMEIGFIPKEFGALLDSMGDSISLDVINAIAARAGHGGGGTSGLDTMLAQDMNLLLGFVPHKRDEVNALIDELNG